MRRLYFVVLALALASCGGGSTPTAPAPPPVASISGGWSGTFEATQNGGAASGVIFMDLTQAAATINGTYTITDYANGTVSGTVTTNSFSGTLTFDGRTLAGTPCTGTFAVSGSAGSATMQWTSPGIAASCQNLPTNITIAVQRR